MARRLVTTALVLLALILIVAAVAVAAQRRLIYLPAAQVATPPQGLATEPLEITTQDGLVLEATFVRAAGDALGTVIVFNGNAGNRGNRYPIATEFSAAGYHTVLFDYRGYGGNPGAPTEEGLIADGLAAVAHARTLQGVESDRIVYFGESLGTGVAVAVAALEPPTVLILRSPYTSLPDAAAASVHLPIRTLIWDEFPSLETIGDVAVPVVVVAGSSDRTVPVSQSMAVFEASGGEKLMVIVDGAGHNDRAVSSDPIRAADLQDFLRRFLDAG